ncbi:murein biosynthesis integral membrane protein MurJ [Jonesia denitrificans]|uniref:Integral membrane protein MviN n=1 Tax=Jonesia denitrificans (strain ATCC 14870 / DSM 20603 / BCRC 15368 / CIP 55.134 / JCM 11481 / NBRC 15587 / NCTC 10816 / Prevot 55134) TaxID=471856 RepID=C7R3N2_JONDD|nr:murein biosynthesis integral membrane protein MurJ [Jonesia denitrificans]ACV10177.1 integral membrane protein MviN [Jonesia denitrificans DSM 20603]ASE08604.1 murein biosynthesis integral membrane protein MurJ [Jonesia denitrificans]QXB43212.1 murein biosynthesis integral membrane protein MurJ [Jonesia denitrificans]SQH23115.1 integral membrane protein MviN [Jonesia denitrificans]
MSSGTPTTDNSQSLGKSSLLMASGTAVSRGLGLIRNILLVAVLGATGLTADAFDVANKIPNILYAMIAGGVLNAVIVPQVTRAYRAKNGDEQVDKLLTFSATILLALTLICTAGATIIVALYTSNDWTTEQTSLAVAFGYWCIPQLFFYGLYTILGQVLNARKQFGPYMWAPALNNVISIIGFALFLWIFGPHAITEVDALSEWTGPKVAVIGVSATAGVMAQALILLVPLYRSGFRWTLRFGLRGFGLRTVGKVGLWTTLAILLDQLAVWITTKIATAAPDASTAGVDVVAGNAAYTQALMIYLLPHSLVTVSVATALFTGMSAAVNAGDISKVRELVSQGLRVIAVFTVFATALFLVLSVPVTKVIIPTLSPAEVGPVSRVLFAMALGLVPLGAMVMMKWVYFAFEDGRSVFLFQIPVVIVLIGGAVVTMLTTPGEWWVFGIGLSMAASNLVAVVLRVRGITERLNGLDVARIVRLHVQLVVAAAVASAGGYLVLRVWGFTADNTWWWAVFICILVTTVMVALYVLTLQVMRVQELTALLTPIRRKISRR